MVFKELSKNEFDEFANNYHLSSLYQTSNYAITSSKSNYKYMYLGLVSDTIIAATLVLVKTNKTLKYGYIPKGILIDYKDKKLLEIFTKNLKKYLSKKDIVAVKLNPIIIRNIYDSKYNLISSNSAYHMLYNNLINTGYTHLGYNKYFESLMPRYEAIIKLSKDNYEMFSHLSKKYRTKARSAENKGVRIYKQDDNLEEIYKSLNVRKAQIDTYLNMYKDFIPNAEIYVAKLDTSIYLKYCQEIYIKQENICTKLNDMVMKSKGKLHSKLLNKKIHEDVNYGEYHRYLDTAIKLNKEFQEINLAAILIIKNRNIVTAVNLSYNKQYTSFNASHLLIWKLIEKYGNLNYEYFNLGGLTANVENNKYNGLNNFKLGFGSNVYEYMGDLELVTNVAKYIMYRNNIFKK